MVVRRAIEKLPGVIAAYPFGDTKTVKVLTSTKKPITEKKVNFLFRKHKGLKLVSIQKLEAEEDVTEQNN